MKYPLLSLLISRRLLSRYVDRCIEEHDERLWLKNVPDFYIKFQHYNQPHIAFKWDEDDEGFEDPENIWFKVNEAYRKIKKTKPKHK